MLPRLQRLGEPAQPEDRLADARRPGKQGGVALLRAAVHQLIEAGDPAGGLAGDCRQPMRDECLYAGEEFDAVKADPDGVLAQRVAVASHLPSPPPPPVDPLPVLLLKLDD